MLKFGDYWFSDLKNSHCGVTEWNLNPGGAFSGCKTLDKLLQVYLIMLEVLGVNIQEKCLTSMHEGNTQR